MVAWFLLVMGTGVGLGVVVLLVCRVVVLFVCGVVVLPVYRVVALLELAGSGRAVRTGVGRGVLVGFQVCTRPVRVLLLAAAAAAVGVNLVGIVGVRGFVDVGCAPHVAAAAAAAAAAAGEIALDAAGKAVVAGRTVFAASADAADKPTAPAAAALVAAAVRMGWNSMPTNG
jgi:hypothetical protein